MPRLPTLGALALAFALPAPPAAQAGDSGHYSCSGVGGTGGQRVSLIVRVQDFRGKSGTGRDYVLSALHRDALYKGPGRKLTEYTRENPVRVQGSTTLSSGSQVFFAGTFEMRYGAQASLLLRGELRPDPAAQEAMQVTVTLPCIDVSP